MNCTEKLKILRDKVNWNIEIERRRLLNQLYPLFRQWKGQLPNLRDIFRTEEIDRLLIESNWSELAALVKFVVKTGYKDEPELDENGKPELCRTTALLHHTPRSRSYLEVDVIRDLFRIYDRLDVNYVDERGMTHFHAACDYGCYEVVEKFIELGQDPNNCLEQKSVNSPLHLALTWSHGRIAELLLRNGAHLYATGRFGHTPLHLICQREHDDDLVKLFFKIFDEQHQLVEVNVRDEWGRTPLHYAARSHFKKVIELLLRRGANPNLVDEAGWTPLHYICDSRCNSYEGGNDDLVELFFKINDEMHQLVEVNVGNDIGRTPLHYAVRLKLKKMTELLLRRGSNPNWADKRGWTPLHVICEHDLENESTIFLKFFFDINDEIHQSVEVDPQNKDGKTPLHIACSSHYYSLTELLLRRGANANLVDKNGSLPLHIICETNDDVEGAAFLKIFFEICAEKNHTVQVDARNEEGQTPLQLALDYRYKRVAELLLKNGADPNLSNKYGSTALHLICRSNRDDYFEKTFFEICAEKQQKVQIDARDESGQTPLHIALFRGRKNVVELLLRNGANPNLVDENGWTPLHMMCERKNDVESVMIILEIFFYVSDQVHRSIKVDTLDKDGETPLHTALKHENKKMAELLLRRGANPDLVNKNGSTALHLICQSNDDDDFVETFFKICDEKHQTMQVDIRDNLGRTPLQLAVQNFMPDSVELLLNRGADLSGIIFPTTSDIGKFLRISNVYQSLLKGASRVLSVVERLEKKGYELNRNHVSMIMKKFAGYKVTDNSKRIEMLSRDEKLMNAAKKLMINPGLSFSDLIRMQPKTTEKLLTYTDYFKFASSNQLRELPKYSYERCIALVFEIMSKQFHWQWALEFFMELTRYQLPILCCEKIIDLLNNEDLLRITQAAEIVAKEENQNDSNRS